MTEIMKKRIAITLYRMYDTMLTLNKHEYFFGDYEDYMTYRQNEYVKKYLRSEGCITKLQECHAVDNLSAVWEVNAKVLLKLLDQYKEYTKDIDETVKQARDAFKVSVDTKLKHISLAHRLITSKLRRRFYINSLTDIDDELDKRFPWYKDTQSKLEYINSRNKQIGLPTFYMRPNAKKLTKDGLLSSIAIRCTNQLVAMKSKNGATERKDYCALKHLYYEFDVTSSIYTTTYLLNNRKLPDGDLYEMIFKSAFPGKEWNSVQREYVKKFMMRVHFDTTAKAAYFHYCRHEKKPRTENGQKAFEGLFNGLRNVCGQTYDNEIFFHESCIMIDTMYELMQRYEDLHIFQVYDGIYFDKPIEAEVAAVWRQKAVEYEISFHDNIRFENSVSTSGLDTSSIQCARGIRSTTTTCSWSTATANCIYIDKQTGFSSKTYNIVKRNTDSTVSTESADYILVHRYQDISLEEYNRRMSLADNLKGVAHKSNGQGNRKPKNDHYIDELKEYELVNITDANEFRAKAYAAGLNKSKVSRLWKYKVNNNL